MSLLDGKYGLRALFLLPVWLRHSSSPAAAPSSASSDMLAEFARVSPEEVLQRLRSVAAGLAADEVAQRLRTAGRNQVAHEVRHTIAGELASRSLNPLNLLLLSLAVASSLLGDPRAAIMISLMVLLSVSLGFLQEHRSNKAADALRRMVHTTATVRRPDTGDGPDHVDVPIDQLAPGDVVLLSAGDIPRRQTSCRVFSFL
ncbi:cation-transporting P-type ATPase [Paraburkholderia aromaticivorans]|uniref:cation-transporting P-type ATPase n=1 Tax=Paraburkholderia aromaticivorans TaxID=2026199 RepID=UPI001455E696